MILGDAGNGIESLKHLPGADPPGGERIDTFDTELEIKVGNEPIRALRTEPARVQSTLGSKN